MFRLAVVTSIPTPYRDPFWPHVVAHGDLSVTVFYCQEKKADRPWEVTWRRDFDYEVMPGLNLMGWRGGGASLFLNPGVGARLRKGRFDAVVIGGYNHPTMLAAMRAARKLEIPYYLVCESHLLRERGRVKTFLKDVFVRRIVAHAEGLLPTGHLASAYLRSFGAAEEDMCMMPNTPDIHALHASVVRLRKDRERLRAERGLKPGDFVVLFAGRFIPKKRAGLVVRAFAEARLPDDAHLLVLGDGSDRPAIEEQVAAAGLGARVHLLGFVSPGEMAAYYAMSDLFVLPSSETWGVVVLEALAAGLPVVVSDEVGCHPDVVDSPHTGTVVPATDVEAYVQALWSAYEAPRDVEARQAATERFRQQFSYEAVGRRLARFLLARADTRAEASSPSPRAASTP